jgi:hypothetical protein
MASKQITNALKIALALPVYRIANLISYVSQKQSVSARLGVALTFLPIVAITTTIWAFCWLILVWLIYRAAG